MHPPHPVLAHCARFPSIEVAAGVELIEEGVPSGHLYVVETGRFDVIRRGVRVVSIHEPGAFLGEISALLGTAPTASVVTTTAGRVRVIENAGDVVRHDPALLHAMASLLARRLQAVTAYLVDIKRQYADTDSHLALMDQVLAQLMTLQLQGGGAGPRAGSERDDLPDY